MQNIYNTNLKSYNKDDKNHESIIADKNTNDLNLSINEISDIEEQLLKQDEHIYNIELETIKQKKSILQRYRNEFIIKYFTTKSSNY